MNRKTLEELAQRPEVYQKDISSWEKNKLTPNVMTLARIWEELGASDDEILELKQ